MHFAVSIIQYGPDHEHLIIGDRALFRICSAKITSGSFMCCMMLAGLRRPSTNLNRLIFSHSPSSMPFSFEILGHGTGELDSPQLRTMPEILIGILAPFKVCSMTNCIGSPGTVFLTAQSGVGFVWKVQ